jgi:hypothetical protein
VRRLVGPAAGISAKLVATHPFEPWQQLAAAQGDPVGLALAETVIEARCRVGGEASRRQQTAPADGL